MIVFENVTKHYSKGKTGLPALKNINLNVGANEFVILVGSSGAGKSTLLKMITREEKPDKGKIIVGGINYDDLKSRHIPFLRRKLGVVFQDFKLLPKRTVFENIAFAMEIAGMTNSEIKAAVPKAIELVGLVGKENSFPSQLSGGERQRVSIARAVVRQPKILIADEPTGNLDEQHKWEIVRLLEKINACGTNVLLITHDMEIVKKLKRRVVIINGGQIVYDKKTASVTMPPQKPVGRK
ncbi:MAG: cell division ATP-binding protein FtsE [Candidatus Nomurabacteria bacterium]|jgi:cell division transport system ATP-binding protein|nr:cell division ATP-binding protein FtsE [Candidatus Nomurabacteria bacterium]